MSYIGILYFTGIMELSNLLSTAEAARLQALGQPTGTDFNLVSFIIQVWAYMKPFIQAIFLYNPTIWSGYWIWFYYIVCIPIMVGLVFSIVSIMRGVGSS